MENDMVIDAVLWLLLAAAIAFIAYGCRCTRPEPKAAEVPFERKIDRAA
jgi:hypothetical protein